MQYRTLGSTGIKVSALGFGAMRLPTQPDRKVNRAEAVCVIHRAFELGVNYIDTAHGYHGGESEEVVGEALKGWRDRVTVSTKNPYKQSSGAEWRKNLETSLRRLGVDCIDLYLYHFLSWTEVSGPMAVAGGPIEEAQKAKKEGKIRFLSFSCHDKPENVHRLIDTGELESMLVQYNLLDRQYAECLQHAHEAGLGTAVMGPVGGGRLGTPSEVISRATGRSRTVETALRFVLANPNVDVVLSGMESKQMVDENVATVERDDPLSEEELARIDRLAEENRRILDLPCTGCRYCVPCPQGVAIPEIFQFYQWHEAFGLKEAARKRYRGLGRRWQEKNKPATTCVECRECEAKCPQKISIVEKLKEAHAALSSDGKA